MSRGGFLDQSFKGPVTLEILEDFCRAARAMNFRSNAEVNSVIIRSEDGDAESSLSLTLTES